MNRTLPIALLLLIACDDGLEPPGGWGTSQPDDGITPAMQATTTGATSWGTSTGTQTGEVTSSGMTPADPESSDETVIPTSCTDMNMSLYYGCSFRISFETARLCACQDPCTHAGCMESCTVEKERLYKLCLAKYPLCRKMIEDAFDPVDPVDPGCWGDCSDVNLKCTKDAQCDGDEDGSMFLKCSEDFQACNMACFDEGHVPPPQRRPKLGPPFRP